MTLGTIGAGTLIGGVTGGVMLLADLVLTGGSSVSLGEAATVGVFAASIVWYLGKKLQRLEDGQSEAKDHFRELDRKLDKLPCRRTADCATGLPKIHPKSPPDTDAY